MKHFRLTILLCSACMLLLGFGSAGAQIRGGATAAEAVPTASAKGSQKLDSVRLRYRFTQGQEVVYRVVAYDSIIIYDTTFRTLARERAELVRFRCDSIVPEGYIMSLTTTDYVATERLDTLPPINRTTHDWVNHTVRFLMSPTGRRIDLIGSVDRPSNAPGGPFEPMLLPNLGEEVGWIGQSGSFTNDEWLTDNIYPPIKWHGTDFRIVAVRKDTLGAKTVQLGISEVGNIAYQPQPGKDKPVTRATLNGGGDYFFAPKLGFMVGGSYDLINKFTLDLPDGRKVDGRHIMSMYYQRMKMKGTGK